MSDAPNITHVRNLANDLPGRFRDLSVNTPVLCVCDANTYEAFAHHFETQFSNESCQIMQLGDTVLASLIQAEKLVSAANDFASIVAIGSGTITDLCKYAAHQAGKYLISIPTAASMNGYNSATASLISADHIKKSYPAKAPDQLLLDEEIYGNAPVKLQRAGLGDTLCRASIQLDARLSHLLFNSWYDGNYFDALIQIERELLTNVAKFNTHDTSLCSLLMQALLLSGNAMRNAGSSAPASQSEHMIAHMLEQHHHGLMKRFLHGHQIAVTSLTMLRLQRFLLEKPVHLNILKYQRSLEEAAPVLKAPLTDKTHLFANLAADSFNNIWQELQEEAANGHFEIQPLERALRDAGLPGSFESFGLTSDEYAVATNACFASRDRVTFLDIAAMR